MLWFTEDASVVYTLIGIGGACVVLMISPLVAYLFNKKRDSSGIENIVILCVVNTVVFLKAWIWVATEYWLFWNNLGLDKKSPRQTNQDIIENPYYGDADDLHDEKRRKESREDSGFIAVTKVDNVYYDEWSVSLYRINKCTDKE